LKPDPLVEYSGLFFLALLMISTAILWLRDYVRTPHDGASRRSVARRTIVFLACASPPWVAMALGNLSGGMHEPIEFLNPRNGLFAVMFMAGMVWVWAALLYWLFAKGGAEELAHSGHISLMGPRVTDPATVKIIFTVCIAGGVLILIWSILRSV
jgi:hypothetical protein